MDGTGGGRSEALVEEDGVVDGFESSDGRPRLETVDEFLLFSSSTMISSSSDLFVTSSSTLMMVFSSLLFLFLTSLAVVGGELRFMMRDVGEMLKNKQKASMLTKNYDNMLSYLVLIRCKFFFLGKVFFCFSFFLF